MGIIYIASPYTHPDHRIREQRFQDVCRFSARLMKEGLTVFSPIAHSHHIGMYGLPKTWEYWKEVDIEFIKICDSMIVLTIDGWKESIGIAAEIEIAKELGMPITYRGL